MKNTWKFTSILLITLTVLGLYSFSDLQLNLGKTQIKKTGIKDFIVGDTILTEAKLAITISSKKEKVEMDSSSQKILLIGDSMLEQFRWRLRDYVEKNGHEMKSVIWYSSQSEWYGKSDTLTYFINEYKPTYVILVLGANELFVENIISKRSEYAKHVVEQMDTLPYVWVGPPNWKDDTGINQLILRHAGPKNYFPSYEMTMTPLFKRYNDGAHPKPESAALWVDSVASWIMNESNHPILLEKPDTKGTITPNTTILQPWK
jgi:hypothetical protein